MNIEDVLKQALEAYLEREMPAGTIIGNPKWWAQKIARVESQAITEAQEQHCYCGDITRLGVVHRTDSFCDEHPEPKVTGEWKLVPRNPTEEMLVAMDECAEEGYDERLYAGMAASVFMAAVDAAPTPPEAEKQEPVAQPASEEDMKIYKAIADNYRDSLSTPQQRQPLTDEHPLMTFAKECVLGAYQESELADAAQRAIEAAHQIGVDK